MKKKLAMKWVKALRSGKFKQGTRLLRAEVHDTDDSVEIEHCCLGVLGEICGVNLRTLNDKKVLNDGLYETCGILSEQGEPLKGIIRIKIAGKASKFNSLAHANDQGASFRVIASWIEKNYDKL